MRCPRTAEGSGKERERGKDDFEMPIRFGTTTTTFAAAAAERTERTTQQLYVTQPAGKAGGAAEALSIGKVRERERGGEGDANFL